MNDTPTAVAEQALETLKANSKRIAELEAVLDAARPIFDRPNLRKHLKADKWQTEGSMGLVCMIQLRKLRDAVDNADLSKSTS